MGSSKDVMENLFFSCEVVTESIHHDSLKVENVLFKSGNKRVRCHLKKLD